MLEFPQKSRRPFDKYQLESTSGDFCLQTSPPTGSHRDPDIEEMIAGHEQRASTLAEQSETLREFVIQHDPVQLIAMIAFFAGMAVTDSTGGDDARRNFTMYAKLEYLVGLILSGPPGDRDVDKRTSEDIVRQIRSVFDAAEAQILFEELSRENVESSMMGGTGMLFRMEALLDRMAGYMVHLEEIDAEIFDPHRDFYIQHIGFCPSDVVRLVRKHNSWVNEQWKDLLGRSNQETAMDLEGEEEANERDLELHRIIESTYLWTPALIAQSTGLAENEIAIMLQSMSMTCDNQSNFRTPLDMNLARYYPLIRLDGEQYLAAVSWALAYGLHDWMQRYIKDNPQSPLRSKYHRHCSDGAERIVGRSLEGMFGDAAVFQNQHYVSADDVGEIDCLVTSYAPIVIEVKSKSLTEKGRRGNHSRLERLTKEIVDKAFEQTDRACRYIDDEGGRSFSNRQGGDLLQLLSDEMAEPITIVISLERMDPLTFAARQLAESGQARKVWITNVADFLMARDILDNPASFMHYAAIRGRVFEFGIQLFMESDILGAYLNDRLSFMFECAMDPNSPERDLGLGYWSSEINSYFTLREVRKDVEKPETGIPEALLTGLKECTSDYAWDWFEIATSILGSPQTTWKAWRRFLRRHKGERNFKLADGRASIVASTGVREGELRMDEDIPTLVVPRQKLKK